MLRFAVLLFAVCSSSIAVADAQTISVADVVAGIKLGGGPDCSGLVEVLPREPSPEYKVRLDDQGRPIGKDGPATFVAQMGCTHYHSRAVLTWSCWIEVRNVHTSEKMRIGTSSGAHTSPGAALGEAVSDLQNGTSGGAFNTKHALGEKKP